MYRLEDHRHGAIYQVFTWDDPRRAGYKGSAVEEGVTLDYDMEKVHTWADGEPSPDECLGRSPNDPKHYKVFKYCPERRQEGFEPLPGTVVVFGSWSDYTKLHLIPPDPNETDDAAWYDYLDKLDEDSRRRQYARQEGPPPGGSRDDVAAWVAKKHLIADSAIREVWYLPQGAPPEEIRLLELNDRLAGNGEHAEAIEFGLDIDGAAFHLFVADITSEQLTRIKQDPSRLPPGWSLDENRVWRRGA